MAREAAEAAGAGAGEVGGTATAFRPRAVPWVGGVGAAAAAAGGVGGTEETAAAGERAASAAATAAAAVSAAVTRRLRRLAPLPRQAGTALRAEASGTSWPLPVVAG